MKLSLRTINFTLAVVLILVMGGQLGFDVRVGRAAVAVTLGDAVLALAAIGVALELLSRRGRGVRLPPVQGFALVAVAAVALARSEAKPEAAKEALQLIEYFLIAFLVFLNIAESGDVKALLAAFAVATAAIAVWAAWHYLACESPLDVRGSFKNRNALGAFLALALPVLYGLALHVPRWGPRIALLAIVALGLLVNLSGGAVLVTLLVLGLLSALRGQRALLPYLIVLGVVLVASPRLLPRRHHGDILFSSAAPFVDDNFLLGDEQLFARARELRQAAHDAAAASRQAGNLVAPPVLAEARRGLVLLQESVQLTEAERKLCEMLVAELEKPQEVYPPRALFDARNLMGFLARRLGGERHMAAEQRELYLDLLAETDRVSRLFPEIGGTSALAESQVAVRYQRWHAAIVGARTLWGDMPTALFGRGYVDYHAAIDKFRPHAKFQYLSNEPEVYNVATSEPFTHDIWLKALVQTGLVGLLALGWLVAVFVGRALRLYGAAHSELMLGVALGAAGGILGFALVGLFTETVARGLAIPFVFVCSLVILAERIVHGDGTVARAELAPYD